MRLFALKDATDRDQSVLAVLCHYEATGEYFIDMPPDADPWAVPLVLSSFAARGQWAIGASWSKRWVESRLVPQSRQNLGEVLRENGLDSYDTLRLLEMTDGRNSQDDCYLVPLRLPDCPDWYHERESARVVEAVALQGRRLLVAFRTGEVRLYEGEELAALCDGFPRLAQSPTVFGRVEGASAGAASSSSATTGCNMRARAFPFAGATCPPSPPRCSSTRPKPPTCSAAPGRTFTLWRSGAAFLSPNRAARPRCSSAQTSAPAVRRAMPAQPIPTPSPASRKRKVSELSIARGILRDFLVARQSRIPPLCIPLLRDRNGRLFRRPPSCCERMIVGALV